LPETCKRLSAKVSVSCEGSEVTVEFTAGLEPTKTVCAEATGAVNSSAETTRSGPAVKRDRNRGDIS